MNARHLVRVATLAVASLAGFVTASSAGPNNYHRQGTFVLGGGFNFPVGETADYLSSSGTFFLAGGRHINRQYTLQAEWTHNWIGIKPEILERVESDSVQYDNTYASMWSVTLNVIRRFNPDAEFVPWVTAGGGYYKRNLQITQNAWVYYPPIWDPWWGWVDGGWGPGEAITGHREASGPGFNVGAGIDLTIENGASLYIDVRYHQAIMDGVDMTVIPVTVGVRW